MSKAKKRKEVEKEIWLWTLIRSDRFKAAVGVLLIVFALFILLAEVSFFFTGDEDQSFIQGTGESDSVGNWTGGLGAYLANVLINGLFGVSSLVIPFIVMVCALLLMGVRVESLKKCLIYPILILIWLPIVLEMVFQAIGTVNSFVHFGGGYGEMMHAMLVKNLGWVGETLIMLGVFVGFGFVALGWNRMFSGKEFKLPELRVNFAKKEKEVDEDEEKDEPEEGVLAVELHETHSRASLQGDSDDTIVVNEPGDEDAPPQEVVFEEIDHENKLDKQEPELVFESGELENDGTDVLPLDDNVDDIIVEEEPERDLLAELGPYDPTLDLSNYKFPSPELLKDFSGQTAGVSAEEQRANQERIIQTLRNFNIGVKKIVETIGPTVTLFEIIPEDGVRVSKISNLEKDIMLSLSATGIRLIAPMPGKGTIGIEVPNAHPKIVGMRALILSQRFKENRYDLPVAMGRTITNGVFMFDLASTPHLIVAGATGQGKSVGLNAIITSLLYTKHPSQVKFVLVDPKQLEFSIYKDIERHYLAKLPDMDEAVITDSKKVITTLESVCQEMEDRYYLLSLAKVRNIKEYNTKFVERRLNPNHGHRYLPYIVVILDEFGDLIATEGKRIETPIQRITQKARAAGIHMILATQRPSVNVITGVIKANCPTRIAFRVISKTDSMTILDCTGADQLIGRGDMLYSKGTTPERVQCAFVDTPEVEKIVEHIHAQQSYPEAYELPEPKAAEGEEGGPKEFSIQNCDKLFNEVAEYVVSTQLGSTSNLQRKFEIGFNRAGKLMDQLEGAGIVGPAKGSKPREILVKTVDELWTLLESYR